MWRRVRTCVRWGWEGIDGDQLHAYMHAMQPCCLVNDVNTSVPMRCRVQCVVNRVPLNFRVQCAVYRVKCAVCRMLCTVCHIVCARTCVRA